MFVGRKAGNVVAKGWLAVHCVYTGSSKVDGWRHSSRRGGDDRPNDLKINGRRGLVQRDIKSIKRIIILQVPSSDAICALRLAAVATSQWPESVVRSSQGGITEAMNLLSPGDLILAVRRRSSVCAVAPVLDVGQGLQGGCDGPGLETKKEKKRRSSLTEVQSPSRKTSFFQR